MVTRLYKTSGALRKEINGVDGSNASVPVISHGRPFRDTLATFGALWGSGFRRFMTYRQATIAGTFTNIVFGFLRCYVLLAVSKQSGQVAGYSGDKIATYVWIGQGLLNVVYLWSWTELSDRIRTGEVVSDLLRPVHPLVSYLAADLGRAGHAAIFRLLPPLAAGAIFFDLYEPQRWFTIPLFVVSVLFATVSSLALRFLVNATAYWLHDARGPVALLMFAGTMLGGVYFPLRFLPEWLTVTLWVATPFPSLMQTPLDVLVELDPAPVQGGLVVLQAGWAVVLLTISGYVQRRAERRLVAQGG